MIYFRLLGLLSLVLFLCIFDLPDRLAAERNGVREARVTAYELGSGRRPLHPVIQTETGEQIRATQGWIHRWKGVGETTQWTKAENVYVGGLVLRWFTYMILFPIALYSIPRDIIRYCRYGNHPPEGA